MKSIMIASMESGSGKTLFTCGLTRALKSEGYEVYPKKTGPDYIDPMYLKAAADKSCKNLDIFLAGEDGVRNAYFGRRELSNENSISVVESAMGYFDGEAMTERASSFHVAGLLGIPVILLVKPGKNALTLAAQIKGMISFGKGRWDHIFGGTSMIAGVVINDCKKERYLKLRDAIEKHCDLPVIGHVPHIDEAFLPSRHLGLDIPDHWEDFLKKADLVSEEIQKNVDVKAVCEIAKNAGEATFGTESMPGESRENKAVIAVAYDEAFSFYYANNLDALSEEGGRIVFFSPIHDKSLPKCDALYLGGGYPELFAKKLSDNSSMLCSIRETYDARKPIIAECGGFMYLMDAIRDREGQSHPMAGIFEGECHPTDGTVRFGYAHMTAKSDSMLFKKGERIPIHEYHHWDADNCGRDLLVEKSDGRKWQEGYATDHVYAAFMHLYFKGKYDLAKRFIRAAVDKREDVRREDVF